VRSRERLAILLAQRSQEGDRGLRLRPGLDEQSARTGQAAPWLLTLACLTINSACPSQGSSTRCNTSNDCPQGYSCDEGEGVCRSDGVVGDAGATDTSTSDIGSSDIGSSDTGVADAASPDATSPDAATATFSDLWWDGAWSHRVRLRFHAAERSDDLVDFPVVVLLHADFDYATARTDGADLRFVDRGGQLLPHEIERWERNGNTLIWLSLPHVPAGSADDYIFLYYGNPAPPGVAIEDPVLSDAFQLAMTMSPEGSGAIDDRSSYHHDVILDGVVTPVLAGPTAYVIGIGAPEVIRVPDLNTARFPQPQGTLSMLLRATDWSSVEGDLLDTPDPVRDHLHMWIEAGTVHVAAEGPGNTQSQLTANLPTPAAGWERYTVTWDLEQSQNQLKLYGEDASVSQTSVDLGWRPTGQMVDFFGDLGPGAYDGQVDNITIHNLPATRDQLEAWRIAAQDRFIVFEQAPTSPAAEVSPIRSWAGSPVALYDFDDGADDTVHDSSGVAPPLDLVIDDLAAVKWDSGALQIERATVLISSVNADKIASACQASNAISIEVWVQPSHDLFAGPARIVSMAANIASADFVVGQSLLLLNRSDPCWSMRLRTTDTDLIGRVGGDSPRSSAEPAHLPRQARTQVVFTSDGSRVCSYVDGVPSPDGCEPWTGNFSNWAPAPLRLVNEWDHRIARYHRPWLGTLYRVAIYCETLSPDDVSNNYLAGTGQ